MNKEGEYMKISRLAITLIITLMMITNNFTPALAKKPVKHAKKQVHHKVISNSNTSKDKVKAEAIQTTDSKFKVAVIDIQRIIESSSQIKALQSERKDKMDDLAAFVEKARSSVEKEKDLKKKKILEDKYNKELNLRKEAIDKNYNQKLSDIDKEITDLIKEKSTAAGYDLVLTKNTVLNGGVDITSEIIQNLK